MKSLRSVLTLLALLLLAGCTTAPSLLGGIPRSEDGGTALVTLTGWTRQVLATASDVSTVSLSVTPVGGNPFFGQRREVASSPTGSASTAFTGLSAGVWRVEAIALGTTRAPLGKATADVTIQVGQTAAVTMALRLDATNGLKVELSPRAGYVRWASLMPEASESPEVAMAFANTFLDNDGNQWSYRYATPTGTRSATYSVRFDPEFGFLELALDVAGLPPMTRALDPENSIDELHALPLGAQLVATGSETVLGSLRPFRKFVFTLNYPYQDDRWVQVTTTRWVAPGLGAYREETTEHDQGAVATSSLELTGTTLL